MTDLVDMLKKDIYNIAVSNALYVDAFLTGSTSREEERFDKDHNIISDIDVLVVLKNKIQFKKVKRIFENEKKRLNKLYNREISIIFCMYNNLKKSRLADYVLSIDFNTPIVKGLKENYNFYQVKTSRIMYQMQSCLYYYSKYIVTQNNVYLLKCFLNVLKCLLYRNNGGCNLSYMRDNEIACYDEIKQLIDKDELEKVICRVHSSEKVEDDLVSKVYELTISLIEDSIDCIKKNKEKLTSLKYFLTNKHKFLIEKNVDCSKKYLELVILENLGIDKRNAIV